MGHVVVGVVADHVPLRHHPDQGLLVPSHGSGVVKVQVVRVDEEGGSHANLGVECDLLSQETHNNTKVVIFIKERVEQFTKGFWVYLHLLQGIQNIRSSLVGSVVKCHVDVTPGRHLQD